VLNVIKLLGGAVVNIFNQFLRILQKRIGVPAHGDDNNGGVKGSTCLFGVPP